MLMQNYLLRIGADYVSWIIPIFCVFLGAFLETIRRHYDEKKKLKKEEEKQKLESKKHEAELNKIKMLIKSEIELNVENLKRYNERYLKMSISRIPSSKKRNEIYLDFYKNLNSFPIFLMKHGIITPIFSMRFL